MKLKNNISIILLIIALLIGLSLLLYPTVSNHWNQSHQSHVIANYVQDIENLNDNEYEEILQSALKYNETLASRKQKHVLSTDERNQYRQLLNVGTAGVMGYIEIPSINCYLPIYHGADDSAMQVGIGHLEWTSLPVGGESSHCVLSGHRGLPSARLFTDLDKLKEKDTFNLYVLDEVLVYEVDRILIVEPEQTEELCIVDGGDYCTLVTCTPYGVNTHRLLIRGKRIDDKQDKKNIRVPAEAVLIEPKIVAAIIAVPMFLALIVVTVIIDRKKRLKRKIRRKLK